MLVGPVETRRHGVRAVVAVIFIFIFFFLAEPQPMLSDPCQKLIRLYPINELAARIMSPTSVLSLCSMLLFLCVCWRWMNRQELCNALHCTMRGAGIHISAKRMQSVYLAFTVASANVLLRMWMKASTWMAFESGFISSSQGQVLFFPPLSWLKGDISMTCGDYIPQLIKWQPAAKHKYCSKYKKKRPLHWYHKSVWKKKKKE